MIELRNISKVYKIPSSKQRITVLDNIDFYIKEGDFVSIRGKSGAGKSTLLNIITGLIKPTKGKVLLGGKEVRSFFDIRSSKFRSQNIGFVFQDFSLIDYHTVLENVIIPLKFSSIKSKLHKKLALALLNDLEIYDKKDAKPKQLSGGQQQRIAIARALIKKPKLILADEPTGNLDANTTLNIIDLFLKINKKYNTAFIIATHNKEIARQSSKTYKIEDNALCMET